MATRTTLSAPDKPVRQFIIAQCTKPRCRVMIRRELGAHAAVPVCIWHKEGKAYLADEPSWPPGMPDPACPWPWLSQDERDVRIRMPHWQARFRHYAQTYAHLLTTPAAQPLPVASKK